MNAGTGAAEQWLITFTQVLRAALPSGQYIITHARTLISVITKLRLTEMTLNSGRSLVQCSKISGGRLSPRELPGG